MRRRNAGRPVPPAPRPFHATASRRGPGTKGVFRHHTIVVRSAKSNGPSKLMNAKAAAPRNRSPKRRFTRIESLSRNCIGPSGRRGRRRVRAPRTGPDHGRPMPKSSACMKSGGINSGGRHATRQRRRPSSASDMAPAEPGRRMRIGGWTIRFWNQPIQKS